MYKNISMRKRKVLSVLLILIFVTGHQIFFMDSQALAVSHLTLAVIPNVTDNSMTQSNNFEARGQRIGSNVGGAIGGFIGKTIDVVARTPAGLAHAGQVAIGATVNAGGQIASGVSRATGGIMSVIGSAIGAGAQLIFRGAKFALQLPIIVGKAVISLACAGLMGTVNLVGAGLGLAKQAVSGAINGVRGLMSRIKGLISGPYGVNGNIQVTTPGNQYHHQFDLQLNNTINYADNLQGNLGTVRSGLSNFSNRLGTFLANTGTNLKLAGLTAVEYTLKAARFASNVGRQALDYTVRGLDRTINNIEQTKLNLKRVKQARNNGVTDQAFYQSQLNQGYNNLYYSQNNLINAGLTIDESNTQILHNLNQTQQNLSNNHNQVYEQFQAVTPVSQDFASQTAVISSGTVCYLNESASEIIDSPEYKSLTDLNHQPIEEYQPAVSSPVETGTAEAVSSTGSEVREIRYQADPAEVQQAYSRYQSAYNRYIELLLNDNTSEENLTKATSEYKTALEHYQGLVITQ